MLYIWNTEVCKPLIANLQFWVGDNYVTVKSNSGHVLVVNDNGIVAVV